MKNEPQAYAPKFVKNDVSNSGKFLSSYFKLSQVSWGGSEYSPAHPPRAIIHNMAKEVLRKSSPMMMVPLFDNLILQLDLYPSVVFTKVSFDFIKDMAGPHKM